MLLFFVMFYERGTRRSTRPPHRNRKKSEVNGDGSHSKDNGNAYDLNK